MKNRAAALGMCAALLACPCMGSPRALNPGQQNGANEAHSGSQQKNNTQKYNENTWNSEQTMQIVKSVRHEILSLPEYSVFDWLTFSVQGHTVILHGYASRPTLKSAAEKVVKNIKGVESVQNEIKVLPYSPNDDQIRVGTLVRVYGQPALRRYTSAPISETLYPTVARQAGGITQDPPVGYFAIHIIVDNGHVTLEGVVDSASDAEIADVQANSVPGVFSVTDDLAVPNQNKEKMK